jgi:hypothetical protein
MNAIYQKTNRDAFLLLCERKNIFVKSGYILRFDSPYKKKGFVPMYWLFDLLLSGNKRRQHALKYLYRTWGDRLQEVFFDRSDKKIDQSAVVNSFDEAKKMLSSLFFGYFKGLHPYFYKLATSLRRDDFIHRVDRIVENNIQLIHNEFYAPNNRFVLNKKKPYYFLEFGEDFVTNGTVRVSEATVDFVEFHYENQYMNIAFYFNNGYAISTDDMRLTRNQAHFRNAVFAINIDHHMIFVYESQKKAKQALTQFNISIIDENFVLEL